jgi:hypothetical protein
VNFALSSVYRCPFFGNFCLIFGECCLVFGISLSYFQQI